jgi:hypothetical protein
MVEVVVVGLDLMWLNQPHRLVSEIRKVALSPKVAAAQLKIARMTNCGAVLFFTLLAPSTVFSHQEKHSKREHTMSKVQTYVAPPCYRY